MFKNVFLPIIIAAVFSFAMIYICDLSELSPVLQQLSGMGFALMGIVIGSLVVFKLNK